MLEPILSRFAVCCRGYFAANQLPAATRKAKFGNGRRVCKALALPLPTALKPHQHDPFLFLEAESFVERG